MSNEPTRSAQVVADFRRRRLAQAALRRIQDLLRGFEEERAFDRRAARFGVILLVLLLVAVSIYLFSAGHSLVIGQACGALACANFRSR